jgi:hypothetical protein
MTPIRVRHKARLALLSMLLVLSACEPASLAPEPARVCTESGAQCLLPSGPLGVCERAPCGAGETGPCFQCTPQH